MFEVPQTRNDIYTLVRTGIYIYKGKAKFEPLQALEQLETHQIRNIFSI